MLSLSCYLIGLVNIACGNPVLGLAVMVAGLVRQFSRR